MTLGSMVPILSSSWSAFVGPLGIPGAEDPIRPECHVQLFLQRRLYVDFGEDAKTMPLQSLGRRRYRSIERKPNHHGKMVGADPTLGC